MRTRRKIVEHTALEQKKGKTWGKVLLKSGNEHLGVAVKISKIPTEHNVDLRNAEYLLQDKYLLFDLEILPKITEDEYKAWGSTEKMQMWKKTMAIPRLHISGAIPEEFPYTGTPSVEEVFRKGIAKAAKILGVNLPDLAKDVTDRTSHIHYIGAGIYTDPAKIASQRFTSFGSGTYVYAGSGIDTREKNAKTIKYTDVVEALSKITRRDLNALPLLDSVSKKNVLRSISSLRDLRKGINTLRKLGVTPYDLDKHILGQILTYGIHVNAVRETRIENHIALKYALYRTLSSANDPNATEKFQKVLSALRDDLKESQKYYFPHIIPNPYHVLKLELHGLETAMKHPDHVAETQNLIRDLYFAAISAANRVIPENTSLKPEELDAIQKLALHMAGVHHNMLDDPVEFLDARAKGYGLGDSMLWVIGSKEKQRNRHGVIVTIPEDPDVEIRHNNVAIYPFMPSEKYRDKPVFLRTTKLGSGAIIEKEQPLLLLIDKKHDSAGVLGTFGNVYMLSKYNKGKNTIVLAHPKRIEDLLFNKPALISILEARGYPGAPLTGMLLDSTNPAMHKTHAKGRNISEYDKINRFNSRLLPKTHGEIFGTLALALGILHAHSNNRADTLLKDVHKIKQAVFRALDEMKGQPLKGSKTSAVTLDAIIQNLENRGDKKSKDAARTLKGIIQRRLDPNMVGGLSVSETNDSTLTALIIHELLGNPEAKELIKDTK